MHLFENIASNIIGLVLLIIPAGSTATSASVLADIASSTPTTTVVAEITLPDNHSFFGAFRSTLSHWKKSLDDSETKGGRSDGESTEGRGESHKDESSEHGKADVGQGVSSSTTSEHARSGSNSATRGEHERKDALREEGDDEGEDEDEGTQRGKKVVPPAPTTVAPVTPTPVVTPAPTTAGITMAVVAAHNTQASCYTVVSGVVYDVTSWIAQHPGGSSAILSMCGKDGTAAFTGQHGGQARPASELASFKLGALVQ